jgi:RimJ/RimL family protein N-acetyltransferase
MNKNISMRLATNRLELIAATRDYVCAELESTERLASLLKAHVEPGWPPGEYDRDAQMFFRDRLEEGGEAAIGWYCWYALRHGSPYQVPVLIGAGGYFGPPSEEGVVEIGFSIMPAWQNNGYATELADLLIKNAFTDDRVRKVIAHTSPMNFASCKVIEKCGFRCVSKDEESGNNLYAIMRNIDA